VLSQSTSDVPQVQGQCQEADAGPYPTFDALLRSRNTKHR